MRRLLFIAADLAVGVPIICACMLLEWRIARGSERAQVIQEVEEWP